MKTTTTNADTVEKIVTSQNVGNTTVHKESVIATQQVDSKELAITKCIQVVWLLTHMIGLVILLRFTFLLFDANLYGFAGTIYNISVPLVRMFQGIFAAPQVGGAYFDSAAILALAMWYVLGFLVTYIISLFSNRNVSRE